MLYLQCPKERLKKIVLSLTLLLSISCFGQRQLNNEEHDEKPYYFGISLGLSRSTFHTSLHPNFLTQDSVHTAEAIPSVGFNLGLSATVRLGKHLELRGNPQLMFLDRPIQYTLKYPDVFENSTTIQKKVESVIVSAPLQLRFLSDRIGNFRFYAMGGGKIELDLASNAQSRKAEDMVVIRRGNYGFEGGIGFKLYYPSFILSPEIKFSNGIRELHFRTPNLIYSNVVDKVLSRMIVFTLHLEG